MSNSWLSWSRSRLPLFSFSAKLRVASLAILDALTTAVGASRFTLLRTRAMLLVAMVSLPAEGEAVGRDEVRGYHALPGRPWLAL